MNHPHHHTLVAAAKSWRLSLAALVFALLPLVLSAAENPFVGRWALTLPSGGAGWLGVEQKGDSLAASLLWGGGSVLPVSEVSVAGDTLKVRITSGKSTREITATRAGDDLKLTTAILKPDGTASNPEPFSGQRIADLPPKPDLTKVVFGAPVKVLAGDLDATWRLVDEKDLNGWSLKDGVLANRLPEGKHPRLGNLRTRAVFDDFRLTTEVRTQPGSNSGIYLRGIYEIQIADSFGKPVDSHNMGALYSRITPSVAAEKPVGEWQTLAITLVQRHVTVVLNGQTIIDNQPVLGCTGGALTAQRLIETKRRDDNIHLLPREMLLHRREILRSRLQVRLIRRPREIANHQFEVRMREVHHHLEIPKLLRAIEQRIFHKRNAVTLLQR